MEIVEESEQMAPEICGAYIFEKQIVMNSTGVQKTN